MLFRVLWNSAQKRATLPYMENNSTTATPVNVENLSAISVTLGAGASVEVPLASAVFDVAEGTVGTAAVQLADHPATYGVVVSNTHATQTVTVGGSTVTATRFILKILAGSSSPLIPVANSNLLYVFGSAASTTYTYGGY